MAGIRHFNALMSPATPSSGSAWADRVIPRAMQYETPLIYPESPLVQGFGGYDAAAGRVYDPGDIQNRLLNPPTYASEYGIEDLPGYLPVRRANEMVPAPPRNYLWLGAP